MGCPARSREARQRVGYLPENPYFYKFLTGAETVAFHGRLCGLRGRELKGRVAELLDLVGLGEAGDRRVGTYSKGMLQRVGLAQALVNDPEVVFLDEPMSGLDPVGRRQVRSLVIALRDRVAERPNIAAYLASDRRIPFNKEGIFRHYKELDK